MGFIRSDFEENAVFVPAKRRSRGGAIRKFQGFSNCLSPRRVEIIRFVFVPRNSLTEKKNIFHWRKGAYRVNTDESKIVYPIHQRGNYTVVTGQ